jgi:hypothetical protein
MYYYYCDQHERKEKKTKEKRSNASYINCKRPRNTTYQRPRNATYQLSLEAERRMSDTTTISANF